MPRRKRAPSSAASCVVCKAPDVHHCSCPWHLPFEKWPKDALALLRARVLSTGGPYAT